MKKPEISAETKQLWKELRARRKALGIEYEHWCILCDTAAHPSLTEYWRAYRAALGREKATDFLIALMRVGYEALDQAREQTKTRRERGSKLTRRSSP